ncbi:hypothetical protein LVJ94_00965 [Pendulispora rubella]|uniref:STAS domain-containing protein n=1 Tax=Pendulispora rubella TaxID=2741070 RepID=A0ABZ2L7C1_9BACT
MEKDPKTFKRLRAAVDASEDALPLRGHHLYDPEEEILFVSFPKGFHLETRAQVEVGFDRALEVWRSACGGRRVYFVVDYTNFSLNLNLNDFYVQQVKRVLNECAVTIVRFGGDPLARTGARLRSMKLHMPSHLYDSREEAIAVVRALRQGRMEIA